MRVNCLNLTKAIRNQTNIWKRKQRKAIQFMPHVVCRYKSLDLFGVIRHLTGGWVVYFPSVFNLVWCCQFSYVHGYQNSIQYCNPVPIFFIVTFYFICIFFKWSYVFNHCPVLKSPLNNIRPRIVLYGVWCETELDFCPCSVVINLFWCFDI